MKDDGVISSQEMYEMARARREGEEKHNFKSGNAYGISMLYHMAKKLKFYNDAEYVYVMNQFLELYHEEHKDSDFYVKAYSKTEEDAHLEIRKHLSIGPEGHGGEEE